MNKFIQAIKSLDFDTVSSIIQKEPKWINWHEDDGRNALHYLGGVTVTDDDTDRSGISLKILKLLLEKGMDINSVHRIADQGCDFFPATPLWYAYTRGRNKAMYNWLLQNGANPQHCMFAIAWYNDVEAAALFKQHGAHIEQLAGRETPFLSAYNWKRYEVAEWLLQHGADVNTADDKGNTALFYAVKRKLKPGYINLLLRYNANPNQENNEGVSPRALAEQNRQRGILNLFKS